MSEYGVPVRIVDSDEEYGVPIRIVEGEIPPTPTPTPTPDSGYTRVSITDSSLASFNMLQTMVTIEGSLT